MLPAHAGVILYIYMQTSYLKNVTRTRGGDPYSKSTKKSIALMLPAHAGVILAPVNKFNMHYNVTRTRGGDPISY